MIIHGKAFQIHGGEGIGNRGQEDKAFAHSGHLEIHTAHVDQNDAGESDCTADHLGCGELFLMKDQACHQNCHKYIYGFDNGCFDSTGVCQADIEKVVLDDGLQHAEPQDSAECTAFRSRVEKFPGNTASDQDCQKSCQCEPQARKQDLGGGVRGPDCKQLIADLDAGECAAPQGTAKHGTQPYDDGFLHPLCFCKFLVHSRMVPFLKQIAKLQYNTVLIDFKMVLFILLQIFL